MKGVTSLVTEEESTSGPWENIALYSELNQMSQIRPQLYQQEVKKLSAKSYQKSDAEISPTPLYQEKDRSQKQHKVNLVSLNEINFEIERTIGSRISRKRITATTIVVFYKKDYTMIQNYCIGPSVNPDGLLKRALSLSV